MKTAKLAGDHFLEQVLKYCNQLGLKIVCNASYGFLNAPDAIAACCTKLMIRVARSAAAARAFI